MAKKSTKTARKDQYREILAKAGIRFEDCRVLAFAFERPLGPETFHLHLMNAHPRPDYHLFDCYENMANVIIPADEQISVLTAKVNELEKDRRANFWEIRDIKDEIAELETRRDPKFMCELCYSPTVTHTKSSALKLQNEW